MERKLLVNLLVTFEMSFSNMQKSQKNLTMNILYSHQLDTTINILLSISPSFYKFIDPSYFFNAFQHKLLMFAHFP